MIWTWFHLFIKDDGLRNSTRRVQPHRHCSSLPKDISFASFRHTSRPSPLLVDVTLVHQSHVGVLRPHHFSMAPLNKAMSAFSSPQFRSPPEGKLRDGQTQDKPRSVIEQGCNKAGLQRNGVRQAPSGSRAT